MTIIYYCQWGTLRFPRMCGIHIKTLSLSHTVSYFLLSVFQPFDPTFKPELHNKWLVRWCLYHIWYFGHCCWWHWCDDVKCDDACDDVDRFPVSLAWWTSKRKWVGDPDYWQCWWRCWWKCWSWCWWRSCFYRKAGVTNSTDRKLTQRNSTDTIIPNLPRNSVI